MDERGRKEGQNDAVSGGLNYCCFEDGGRWLLKAGKGKKTDYSLDYSLILSQWDCFGLLIYITVRWKICGSYSCNRKLGVWILFGRNREPSKSCHHRGDMVRFLLLKDCWHPYSTTDLLIHLLWLYKWQYNMNLQVPFETEFYINSRIIMSIYIFIVISTFHG